MLDTVIDTDACPLHEDGFTAGCRDRLARDGVVTIPGFLRSDAVSALVTEAESQARNAHFTSSTHNVYLTPTDPALAGDHVFNRQIISSKGCITTDQVPDGSTPPIYGSAAFQRFIAAIVGVPALFEYADPLRPSMFITPPTGRSLAGISTIPASLSRCCCRHRRPVARSSMCGIFETPMPAS